MVNTPSTASFPTRCLRQSPACRRCQNHPSYFLYISLISDASSSSHKYNILSKIGENLDLYSVFYLQMDRFHFTSPEQSAWHLTATFCLYLAKKSCWFLFCCCLLFWCCLFVCFLLWEKTCVFPMKSEQLIIKLISGVDSFSTSLMFSTIKIAMLKSELLY